MEINIFFEKIKSFKINFNIKDVIVEICEDENKETGCINFIFCSDDYILDLNKKYLNHNYYTDIITFNYNEGDIISGDIFISKDTVAYNAEKYRVNFLDELKRVMIHGILHLIGYNDKNEEEKRTMTEMENKYLK